MARKQSNTEAAGAGVVWAAWLEQDLSAAAHKGDLAPAFEVDDAIDEISALLNAGRRPVLVGEAGVGKTAIIHEMVRRSVHEGPSTGRRGCPALIGRRILQLSIRRRAAAMKDPRAIGVEFQKLIDAAVESGDKLALFFTDFDACNGFNLETMLQTLSLRFEGPVIAEGRRGPIDSMLEYSPELQQNFTLVDIPEPDIDRTLRILAQWSDDRRARGRTPFSPAALTEAVYLTHRFLSRQQLPRKAVDLLCETAVLKSGAAGEGVTPRDIVERFAATHRVPRWLVDPAMPLDLAAMEADFTERVLGQPEAVSSVVSMIGLIKAGLSDMRRPFGVFLFVGPTGVGKTHIAQLLAETLFGRRDRMVRINMADYGGEGSAPVLFGDPADSRPAQQRGILSQRMMGHPFAVLLLDEFEKAHAGVHDRFLQMMDEGAFINGAGETVSCRSLIIIATSNVGAEVYRYHAFGFSGPKDLEAKDKIIDQKLDGAFRFEFLNRFDRIVHFHPLTRADIRTIALRELEHLEKRAGIEQRKLSLDIDESVLDWLTAHGYDPDYGARYLRRMVERTVTVALADAIVREGPGPGDRIGITVRQGRIVARVVRPEVKAAKKEAIVVAAAAGDRLRRLDAGAMRAEAVRLLSAATARLEELESARRERSAVLEQMNEPDFWSSAQRAATVDRYRELDVAVRAGERLAEPFARLRSLVDGPAGEKHDAEQRLARAIEAASRALADWEQRDREDSPAALWLVVSRGEARSGVDVAEFIEQIVGMELGWARRMHLSAGVAGFVSEEGCISRAVVAVEGPGAASIMAMEEGVHRLRRKKRAEIRASVSIVPMGPTPRVEAAAETGLRIRGLGTTATASVRIEVESRGLTVDLCGPDAGVLCHAAADLAVSWSSAPKGEPETSRVYGEDGTAHDPRTGVTAVLRDVLRGRLEGFLEGWRAK